MEYKEIKLNVNETDFLKLLLSSNIKFFNNLDRKLSLEEKSTVKLLENILKKLEVK